MKIPQTYPILAPKNWYKNTDLYPHLFFTNYAILPNPTQNPPDPQYMLVLLLSQFSHLDSVILVLDALECWCAGLAHLLGGTNFWLPMCHPPPILASSFGWIFVGHNEVLVPSEASPCCPWRNWPFIIFAFGDSSPVTYHIPVIWFWPSIIRIFILVTCLIHNWTLHGVLFEEMEWKIYL